MDHKKQFILMHWAGYQLGDPIPHRRLLLSFIYQPCWLQQVVGLFRLATLIPKWIARLLIRQRSINTLYHSLKNKVRQ